jgi:APA family basic amino acid/polyamine antiporter
MGTVATRSVAVTLVLLLSAVNYVGVRAGSRVQTALTAVKLTAVVLIVALGVLLGGRVPQHFVGAAAGGGDSAAGIRRAMSAALFAYGGWHMVTYSADETVDPARTIPRALLWGTVLVTVAYIAMNAAYLYVLPLDQVASSSRVAADFADVLLGGNGGAIMSAIVILSGIGALTGIILSGPRVYFAMAQDRLLFSWLGELHPRYATPHRAILLQGIWASILAATGTFRALFTRVVYTEWIFFALLAFGLVVLRRRPGIVRQYAIPWSPALPMLFIAVSLTVVVSAILADPIDSTIGLSLVLAGIPVYFIWRASSAAHSTEQSS